MLCDKNCPLKKFMRNQSYVDKPWITKGIESACIKDDAL